VPGAASAAVAFGSRLMPAGWPAAPSWRRRTSPPPAASSSAPRTRRL